MMKTILLAGLLCLTAGNAIAQKTKFPDTYNFQRAFEALKEENEAEALEYFNKEVKENPKNGYAHLMIARLKFRNEEYGAALTATDKAIQYIPNSDTPYLAMAYENKADVYLNLEDTTAALATLTTAIKKYPKARELYKARGEIYFDQEKYDLADAEYQKMVALEPGETYGYMGLGRNAKMQQRWDDAIKQFSHVIKLDSEYSSGYAFRAEAYLGKEQWGEATDDLLAALRIDRDDKALYIATSLTSPTAFEQMEAKLKVQAAKEPNSGYWSYVIGLMYEGAGKYDKAVEYYNTANSIEKHPNISERLSNCQYQVRYYAEALSTIEEAITMDSTDMDYYLHKAKILFEMDNLPVALVEYNNILAKDPEVYSAYYSRANLKEIVGDKEGAMEDFSTLIALVPQNSYAYASRAYRYLKQGKKDLAEADFQKIIALENTPEKYAVIAYAYQGLGQNDKAIAALDTIIARDSTSASPYYNAACVYARMNAVEKALQYLEKALELGYNSFTHIKYDYDMDILREHPTFKVLLKKYDVRKTPQKVNTVVAEATDAMSTEVPFTKENGTCKVKCAINDLPLYFVFDTGASDVTLSMVEATFMMKNGYIGKADVVGNQRYMDANGNVNVGTVINLKNVNFGGLTLNNVRASVVRNQKAPLLLGQSVLSRLGKIEIDNAKSVLKITGN